MRWMSTRAAPRPSAWRLRHGCASAAGALPAGAPSLTGPATDLSVQAIRLQRLQIDPEDRTRLLLDGGTSSLGLAEIDTLRRWSVQEPTCYVRVHRAGISSSEPVVLADVETLDDVPAGTSQFALSPRPSSASGLLAWWDGQLDDERVTLDGWLVNAAVSEAEWLLICHDSVRPAAGCDQGLRALSDAGLQVFICQTKRAQLLSVTRSATAQRCVMARCAA